MGTQIFENFTLYSLCQPNIFLGTTVSLNYDQRKKCGQIIVRGSITQTQVLHYTPFSNPLANNTVYVFEWDRYIDGIEGIAV